MVLYVNLLSIPSFLKGDQGGFYTMQIKRITLDVLKKHNKFIYKFRQIYLFQKQCSSASTEKFGEKAYILA